MDKLKRGDQVVFKCTNPATGYVLRVARDGSWADVRWDAGIDCRYVQRVESVHLWKTNPIFNRLVNDPFARTMIPEAST